MEVSLIESVFETRKATALVVAVGRSATTENVRLSADLLVHLNLGHDGHVVGSAKRGALVAMASFWIRHFLFLPCFDEPGYFFSR